MVGKITSDKKLSASVIAVVMDEHPNKEPNDIFNDVMDAVIGVKKPEITDIRLLELFEMGNQAEGAVSQQVAEHWGFNVDAEITDVYRWDDAGIESSLDAVLTPKDGHVRIYARSDVFPETRLPQGQKYIDVKAPINMEIKTRQGYPFDDLPTWLGKGQANVQAKCFGCEVFIVAVRYNGNQTILYVYERDEIYLKRVKQAADDFYVRLKENIPYPSRTGEGAARTHSNVNEDEPPIFFEGEALNLVEELTTTERTIRALTARKKELEPQIMDLMKDNKVGIVTDDLGNEIAKISWPLRKTKARPEKIIPATPAKEERQKSLTIKADWSNGSI